MIAVEIRNIKLAKLLMRLLLGEFFIIGAVDEVGFQFNKNSTSRFDAGHVRWAVLPQAPSELLICAGRVEHDSQRRRVCRLYIAVDQEALAIGRNVIAVQIT
jgi:hypothetical protein